MPSPAPPSAPPADLDLLCRGIAEAVEPTLWLDPLLAAAAAAVGAGRGVLVGPELRPCAWLGWSEAETAALVAPEGLLRRAAELPAPGPAEWRLLTPADAPAGTWPAGALALLWVPLYARGLACGALLLADPARPEGAGALVPLATLAALGLENARLLEEERQASQMREHFLTALNHELRTPATGLVLHAEMLKEEFWGPLPPKLGQVLDKVGGFVEEVVAVLQRLRELAAQVGVQAGERRHDMVEPRRFVGDLLRRVEPTANRKGLRLALFYPRELPVLQTDPSQLGRIVLQVLSNAIRFTEQGKIEVRLSRETVTVGRARRPFLSILVADTGRGIPPEELERVFEPFAQVDEGARSDSRTRGVGLGLPLARTMARALGGDLVLQSRPGAGTRATITIPYHADAG